MTKRAEKERNKHHAAGNFIDSTFDMHQGSPLLSRGRCVFMPEGVTAKYGGRRQKTVIPSLK